MVGATAMYKPTFFKVFFFVFISSIVLACTPKPVLAQRGGVVGGSHGGGGFRSGSMGGLRGGFRGGPPARMGGGPSWHTGRSGFAPRGPAFSRRPSFGMSNGRAGVARPPVRFERQVQDANRLPSAGFPSAVQDGNRPPVRFEHQVQDANRLPSQVQGGDSGRRLGTLASLREVHSSSPSGRSASTIAHNSQNTGMRSQSLTRSANASDSPGSLSVISASRGPANLSHFGTTLLGTSASAITSARLGANMSLFTGTRFADPFENRFGSIRFGRTGFGGASFNRFDPNISHVFNRTFRFNLFGFNRFAFNNLFFDRFFFFNRFGFFPACDFFFFPRFGFFGLPWWWSQSWWDPSWRWGWSSPQPPAWGSSVYNSNPDLSGSSSSAHTESPSTARSESEALANTNPTTGNAAASAPSVLLYFKDGTMYAASEYWFAGSKLHFIVNDAGEWATGMDELDLQRTVDENAKRGVPFTLKQNPNDSNSTPEQE